MPNTGTKTFTPEEIRELIAEFLDQAEADTDIANGYKGDSDLDELGNFHKREAKRSRTAADALEYLLQFVEWKEIGDARKDIELLISDGFDIYAVAQWDEKYQSFCDETSYYPDASHFLPIPPPLQNTKEKSE